MPRRPRSHIIGDQAAGYAVATAHACGYAADKIESDYGIDVNVTTIDDNGNVENGWLRIQSKGTEHPRYLANGDIAVRVDTDHLRYWNAEIYPVILVTRDMTMGRGYWLYVQRYLIGRELTGRAMWLRIPLAQVLDEPAMRLLRDVKNAVHAQILNNVEIDRG
jgi:hypothetical protein